MTKSCDFVLFMDAALPDADRVGLKSQDYLLLRCIAVKSKFAKETLRCLDIFEDSD